MHTPNVSQSVKKYEGNFDLQERVHELLENNNSDSDACLEILSTYGRYVKDRVGELTQRKYPKFIEYANKLDVGAQSLLKVKEGVISLRTTIQQVADLDLRELENNDHLLGDEDIDIHEETTNGKQQLDDLRDLVELAVFECDFEKAASLIITNRDNDAIQERELWVIEESIVEHILDTLRNTPGTTKSLLKILIQLDREDTAIDHFFSHRSRWVRSEVCRVRFLGDVVNYARDSASAIFSGLAATYTEYTQMAENDFRHPPNHLKSSAIRWLSLQIEDFLSLIVSQLMSIEFSDVFQSFTEVLKACRDHLEPLGIDMLPHIHCVLKEDALQEFEKEKTCIERLLRNYFDEEPFKQERDGDDIHAPPLWTRTSRTERLATTMSTGTHELLICISSIVQSVKLVCLDGDKPWGSLEESTDTSIHYILKMYLDASYDLAKAEISQNFSRQQTLLFLTDMSFVGKVLLPRVSQVLCKIFSKTQMPKLNHLQTKFKQSIFTNLVVSEWTKTEVRMLEDNLRTELSTITERVDGHLILSACNGLVQGIARMRYESMAYMSETEAVGDLITRIVQSVLRHLFQPRFWEDLLPQLEPGSSTTRDIIVTNILFLSELAFPSYSSVDDWEGAVEKFSITDADTQATALELDRLRHLQGGDLLDTAIQDLDVKPLIDIPT